MEWDMTIKMLVVLFNILLFDGTKCDDINGKKYIYTPKPRFSKPRFSKQKPAPFIY